MSIRTARSFQVLELESRALLSGFGTPSPAVQADIAKIKTDTATLQADYQTAAPKLTVDYKAIQTAIANSATVKAAKTTLSTDEATDGVELTADIKAVFAATTSAARQTALTQFQTDYKAAFTQIQADITAVQTAINTDPTVQAAVTQYKTDDATVLADQTTLQADYVQLGKDLRG